MKLCDDDLLEFGLTFLEKGLFLLKKHFSEANTR